jgi:CubicO group peptidase (beta-lactamase class C family)
MRTVSLPTTAPPLRQSPTPLRAVAGSATRTHRLLLRVTTAGLLMIALQAAAVDLARLEIAIERGMQDWGIPGLAIAVIDGGAVVLSRGYGRTAVVDGLPVDAATLFANASTTKAMLAAGLLLLVDDGRLTLDAPVIAFLPELRFADPALTPQVTIRDLLTHRTGLPSMDFQTFNQGMPIADQLPRVAQVAPVAPPRARFIYHNTQYELAGRVLEVVTGQPWPTFLRERLWTPIGMLNTFGTWGEIGADRSAAIPHDEVQGVLRPVNPSLLPEAANAAGSVWSSVADMSRWAGFLLADGVTADGTRLLSEQAIQEMFTPQQLIDSATFPATAELTRPNWRSYGLGWFQQDFQGRKIDFHTGSLSGFVAILGLDRTHQRAVVVMANREGAELRHALLWEVMDRRTGAERPDWHADVLALNGERAAQRAAQWARLEAGRIEGLPPARELAAYAGRFNSARSGPLQIRSGAAGLTLHTRVRDYQLTHWHGETFLVMHADWQRGVFARFDLAPDGTITALEAFGDRFLRDPE